MQQGEYVVNTFTYLLYISFWDDEVDKLHISFYSFLKLRSQEMQL